MKEVSKDSVEEFLEVENIDFKCISFSDESGQDFMSMHVFVNKIIKHFTPISSEDEDKFDGNAINQSILIMGVASKMFGNPCESPISSDKPSEEITSTSIINSAEQSFKDLEHKGWEWKSYYNGFLQGGADMWSKLNRNSTLPKESVTDEVMKCPKCKSDLKHNISKWICISQICDFKGYEIGVNKESVTDWISVEDRLPEEDKEVLVNINGFCYVAYWYGDGWDVTLEDKSVTKNPTHWQPLPQPPTETKTK